MVEAARSEASLLLIGRRTTCGLAEALANGVMKVRAENMMFEGIEGGLIGK
jgi:hypothetical protein